ncbi:MAG: chemotaxis protein CheW [Anaerolineae bacterium]|nr:chemotaxis protein CheW [Anaerolineae bacterium]
MENQLVVFRLAQEYYGVDIAVVDGIVKMQPVTRVPGAPAFIEGITNLRGEILPVIDLRKRFGLPAGEVTRETRIVNVMIDGMKVGLIVDGVSEVLRVAEEDVEPPSPLITGIDAAFIAAIAKVGTRLIILLDLSKVLSRAEQLELHTVDQIGNDSDPTSATA